MIFISFEQIIQLHDLLIAETGGSSGVRDFGAIDSAAAQPRMSFGGQDLYPTLAEKAAALSFSLINNHRSSMATSASGTRRRTSF